MTPMSSSTGIYFTINILLAFSLKSKDEKSQKNKNISKKKPEPEHEDPPCLLRLGKTYSAAHIEYELFPGKSKLCQIDVLCWPNAAKIYFSDRTKIFQTVTRQGLTLVPICMEHYLKELSINELVALKNAVVEFNVYTDKNKLGNLAKSNKTECVYIHASNINSSELFVEAFTENPNVSAAKKSTILNFSYTQSQSVASQKNEAYVQMKFAEDFADKFCDIINYLSVDTTIPRSEIIFRDFAKSCGAPALSKHPETSKSSASQPASSQNAAKKSKPITGRLTLQMQCEIFFTDANTIFKLDDSKSEIKHIFIMPGVEKMLTRLQKLQLNPIIIKIKSVQNFPDKLFENTGFTSVYCKYLIPHIAECKTIEKPIQETIRFLESHIFPTHTLPKIKLLEFLETKRFVVELYGIYQDQDTQEPPKLYGKKPGDRDISKVHVGYRRNCLERVESLKTRDILLAYCSYDLSSLLKNVWDFRAKEQLHTAESRILGSWPQTKTNPTDQNSCKFWSNFNVSINQINLIGTSNISPLKEYILIQNNTVLDIEAYLLSPQSASLVLHQIPNTYKRLLMIAFDLQTALQSVDKMLRHNEMIISKESKDQDILTGFIIDNGNNFIIYVEGHSIGFILNLYQDCETILPQKAKIFYNTDQAYESRLYPACSSNKWFGFYIINLRVPLQNIFENQKMYIKGNMPFSCQKALIKLNLMILCNTMKSMLQHDLFPTIQELISLDVEYGVPFAWKPFTGSIMGVGMIKDSLGPG